MNLTAKTNLIAFFVALARQHSVDLTKRIGGIISRSPLVNWAHELPIHAKGWQGKQEPFSDSNNSNSNARPYCLFLLLAALPANAEDYKWNTTYSGTLPAFYPTAAAACEKWLAVLQSNDSCINSTPCCSNSYYYTAVAGCPVGQVDPSNPDRFFCGATANVNVRDTGGIPRTTCTSYVGINPYCVTTSRQGNGCSDPRKPLNPATGSCETLPKNPIDCPAPSTPNPVNTTTGNKHIDFVDVAAEGNSPIKFSRHYNSSPTYYHPNVFGTPGRKRNPIGQYWYHNYHYGLTVLASEVMLTRNTGQTFAFKSAPNAWQPDSDINYRLQETLSGTTRIGWKVTTPDDSVETYNATGDLLEILNRNGIKQTLTYSNCTAISPNCPVATPYPGAPIDGLLVKVTDNFGNKLSFTYSSTGKLATMSDLIGNNTRYDYDASGNLKTVIYPDDTPAVLTDNPKKTYVYGSDTGETVNTAGVLQPNALTGIIDENGVRYATYQYDANGKAISTEHVGSVEKYSLAYAVDGSTAVTDPLSAIRTTHFTTVLGVIKPTGTDQPGGSGCSAASSAVTYDGNGNVASKTDFNGHKACYAYDLARNLETVRVEGLDSGADCAASLSADSLPLPARKVMTEWHPTFRLPTKVTEPGLETAYAYDSKGNTTHKGLKDLITNKVRAWDTTYTYSATGILVQKAEDGPRIDVNDEVTSDYYPEDAACTGGHFGCRGRLKQVTDALGHATKINRYSANGQPEVTVDPNGLATTLAYDARQRLISMDVGGETTTYTYDPAGLLTKATQPNGAYLAYTYDNAHRLVKVKDQLGNTRTYTLDNMGNRLKEDLTDPNGQLARSQTRVYDALSRLQNLILPQ